MNPNALLGIDVSHWNGDVDWNAVKNAGIVYAWSKCNDGDSKFESNRAGAKAAGLLFGSYAWFHPSKDPVEQANEFIAKAEPQAGELLPFLDWEVTEGVPSVTDIIRAEKWLDIVDGLIKRKTAVYGGVYFLDYFRLGGNWAERPLMLAQYRNTNPLIPSPWADWTFWQHSSKGHVAGVPDDADLDWFNGGSIADLQKMTV